jgi:hypothetical protein
MAGSAAVKATPGTVSASAPRARSTPGTLRLMLIVLLAACLGWGALAAVMVSQHASGASDAVGTSDPLSLDAQQLYQSLADADVTVSTAYLAGAQQPASARQRYQADIATVTADLKQVTAASGGDAAASPYLTTLQQGLPVYTGYVEDSSAYNVADIPAGGSFAQVASEQMHLVLLPAAAGLYQWENSQLTAASGEATGLPLAAIAAAAGLIVLVILLRSQRWLTRRTRRTVNGGLFLATAAGVIALGWLIVGTLSARSDLLQATTHGSAPAQVLAQADIGALQARGDEALNLISRTGDTPFQADIHRIQQGLGGQLSRAGQAGTSTAPVQLAAAQWFTVNGQMHQFDAEANYSGETQLALGAAATKFGALQDSFGTAIGEDQATFTAHTPSGRDTFTTMEYAVIVLALIMAAGCYTGLRPRLAEYR